MKVCFTHLGCKLNQAEIERLARDFLAAGHHIVGSAAEADLHVINTCTVTQIAARSSRKAANRSVRTGARTVITGCNAAMEAGAAGVAGVDLIVPNPEKERLLDHVHAAFPDLRTEEPQIPVPYVPLPFGHTRALVKVEDGCNMRCAFCIIPSTRGRQRSRPLPEVVEEARSLVEAGFQEIVITGVQISAYRDGPNRLVELIRALLQSVEAPRLRLTSIAPWDLDERLVGLWSDRRLCRHLHLSLQSGSTETLRRMRRPYSAEDYLDLLDRVRAAIPGVAITTDVIVGFPAETEAEFQASLATVEEARFAKVHLFPYSSRPGTEAASLSGQVQPQEKKARLERMQEIADRTERDFRLAHLGRRETVLWERPSEGVGQGLTDNYLRVLCPEGAALWNRFSEVELFELAEDGLMGRLGGQCAPCF